jgi:hypothetical protein
VVITNTNECIGHQILCIQFTDTSTGFYTAKQFILAAIDSGGSFVPQELPKHSPRSQDPAVRQVETALMSPRGTILTARTKVPSMLESLSLAEVAGAPVVYTNVPAGLVSCGTLRWNDMMYLYRIKNRLLRTYISLYLVSFDLPICISMPRIHIDRTANVKRFVTQLLINLDWCEPLMQMLRAHKDKGTTVSIRKALRLKNDQLMLIRCCLYPKASRYCACIEFMDPLGENILGNQMCIVDQSQLVKSGAIVSPRAYVPIDIEEQKKFLSNESLSATDVEESPVEDRQPEAISNVETPIGAPEAFLAPEVPLSSSVVQELPSPEEPAAVVPVQVPVAPVVPAVEEEVPVPEEVPASEYIEPPVMEPAMVPPDLLAIDTDEQLVTRPPRASSAGASAVHVLAASMVALASQVAQVTISSRPSTPARTPQLTPQMTPQRAADPSPITVPAAERADSHPEVGIVIATSEQLDQPVAASEVLQIVFEPEPAPEPEPEPEPMPAPQVVVEPTKPQQEPVADVRASPVGELPVRMVIETSDDGGTAHEALDSFDPESKSTKSTEQVPSQQPSPIRSPIKRQDTNGRLNEQVLAKKKISAIKTINFLEHERMRLEAFEFLYELGMKTLSNYLREYSLGYLQSRAKEALLIVAEMEEEERVRLAAYAQAQAEAEAEILQRQKEREELKTPGDRKKTPPAKLKKGSSERGMGLRKSGSFRYGAQSIKDEEASRSRKTRSAGGTGVDGEESFPPTKTPHVSTKDAIAASQEDFDAEVAKVDSAIHSDENSEVQPAQLEESGSAMGDSASSSLRGTVSTVSKGESRYMNSILDAMKARDLKTNSTARAHDFTLKQQMLLRQPLDVENLPDYAYESAQGLIMALQAQDREYEDYVHRKAAREMMRIEQLQLFQQREVAYNIQREKDLAQLRLEKKGSMSESSIGVFGPPKQGATKKKRSHHPNKNASTESGNRDKRMLSATVGTDLMRSSSTSTYSGNKQFAATISGDLGFYPNSAWNASGPLETGGQMDNSAFSLYDDEDAEPAMLPPLPLNADFSQTLFYESNAVTQKPSRSTARRSTTSRVGASSTLGSPGKSQSQPMSPARNTTAKNATISTKPALSCFEKPIGMIAEGQDPMEFMISRERAAGTLHVPGEELCQRLLDTHRLHGYIPSSGTDSVPQADTSQFSHQWLQSLQALLITMPNIRIIRKSIAALQKAAQTPLNRLEAFCALASVGGKVPDALGKLLDKEFRMEVSLACKILPIQAIIAEYEGLFELLFIEDKSSARGRSRSRSRSPNKSLSPARTRSPSIQNRIEAFSKPGTASASGSQTPLLLNSAEDRLRIKGLDASKRLPHLNMLQTSNAVRSRSTEVSIIGGSIGGNSIALDATSSEFPAGSGVLSTPGPVASGYFPSISAGSTRSLPGAGSSSSKMFLGGDELSGWRETASSPPSVHFSDDKPTMIGSQDTPAQQQAGSRPMSSIRHEVVFNLAADSSSKGDKGMSVKSFGRKSAKNVAASSKADVMASPSGINNSNAPQVNPSGAIKVEKLVEHVTTTSSPQLLIMSRKDAYRAMEDETLARSTNERFRAMSSQGKIDRRQVNSAGKDTV